MTINITAQVMPEHARVDLRLFGGPPGEGVFVLRHDDRGTAIVRATADGEATWPVQASLDGRPPNTLAAPWFVDTAMGETGTTTVILDGANVWGRPANVVSRSVVNPGSLSFHRFVAPLVGGYGDSYTAGMWVKRSTAGNTMMTVRLRLGTSTITQMSTTVTLAANTWTMIPVGITATNPFDNIEVEWTRAALAGVTYDATEAFVLAGDGRLRISDYETTQGSSAMYLVTDSDGIELPSAVSEVVYVTDFTDPLDGWTGSTVDGVPVVLTREEMVSPAAWSVPWAMRVKIGPTGGGAGTVQVSRLITGLTPGRTYTAEARVLRDPTVSVATAARMGAAADVPMAGSWVRVAETFVPTGTTYDLTITATCTSRSANATMIRVDDVLVSSAESSALSVQVPMWGTWVKSPGRPYMNARVRFVSEGDVTLAGRRVLVDVEGKARRVSLSEARGAAVAQLQLATHTDADARALLAMLSDGGVLMLDTPPAWGLSFRYFTAGDVTVSRPLALENTLNLEADERLFTLAEVADEDAPLGGVTADPGWTYGDLPVVFGSYAAIPALVDTYQALADGQVG